MDTTLDLLHCGACDARCGGAPGTFACVAGTCDVTSCPPGAADCDADTANGCEADLNTVATCGGCGVACALANGTPACVDGTCAVSRCDAGFGDCNATATDGCETDVQTSTTHCGACGNTCPTPSAGTLPFCMTGTCMFRCDTGFADCDGSSGNGCEVDLSSNGSHCGACRNRCMGSRRCVGGACV